MNNPEQNPMCIQELLRLFLWHGKPKAKLLNFDYLESDQTKQGKR